MPHSSTSEFKYSVEEWNYYTECLIHHFIANDVREEEKAILLSVCGASTYKLIRSLLDIAAKSYIEIVDMIGAQYNPNPSPILQRFKSNSRVRSLGELIVSYSAALCNIASMVIPFQPCSEIDWCVESVIVGYRTNFSWKRIYEKAFEHMLSSICSLHLFNL